MSMAEHNELGKWGERYALDVLDREGYMLVETDWRPPHSHGDIDIVAYTPDRTVMVFVEVKTRSREGALMPEDSVDAKKIRNIASCANRYIKQKGYDGDIRFDIISIIGSEDDIDHYEHIVDAFNPNLL